MNTPGVLAKWLYSKGGIPAGEGSADEPRNWKVKMVTDIPEESFDNRMPAAWSPETSDADLGGCLRKVIPAYGQRMGEASGKLNKLLQAEQILAGGARSGLIRVTPK